MPILGIDWVVAEAVALDIPYTSYADYCNLSAQKI